MMMMMMVMVMVLMMMMMMMMVVVVVMVVMMMMMMMMVMVMVVVVMVMVMAVCGLLTIQTSRPTGKEGLVLWIFPSWLRVRCAGLALEIVSTAAFLPPQFLRVSWVQAVSSSKNISWCIRTSNKRIHCIHTLVSKRIRRIRLFALAGTRGYNALGNPVWRPSTFRKHLCLLRPFIFHRTKSKKWKQLLGNTSANFCVLRMFQLWSLVAVVTRTASIFLLLFITTILSRDFGTTKAVKAWQLYLADSERQSLCRQIWRGCEVQIRLWSVSNLENVLKQFIKLGQSLA